MDTLLWNFAHETNIISSRDIRLATPNKDLLVNETFFKQYRSNEELYLLHITTNFNSIQQSQKILQSAGGMVGTIYCSPLIPLGDDTFQMHNLSEYFYLNELKDKSKASFVIFKVNKSNANKNLIGLNHLKLGSAYYKSTVDLLNILNKNEKQTITNRINLSLLKTKKLLLQCNNKSKISIIDKKKFIDLFLYSIPYNPLFGVIYAELLMEFMYLFQDDKISNNYYEQDQFNCFNFKKFRHINKTKFPKLDIFKPDLNDFFHFIKQQKVISNFEQNKFVEYFSVRLFEVLNYSLADGLKQSDFSTIKNLNNISNTGKNLIGHLVYRFVRYLPRYEFLYNFFNTYRSCSICNFWNANNVLLPYNSFIPRGEIGINPAYVNEDNISIFSADISNSKNLTLKIHEKLSWKIEPKLLDINTTALRDQSYFLNNKIEF